MSSRTGQLRTSDTAETVYGLREGCRLPVLSPLTENLPGNVLPDAEVVWGPDHLAPSFTSV